MAVYDRNAQPPRSDGRPITSNDDERLSDLLRRFTQDASALARQEITLAKLELRDNIKSYAAHAAKLGIAAAVGLSGLFAFTAFAIVGLGDLIDNYWLSALIVTLVLLALAGILARIALTQLKRQGVAPDETVATLKEDQQWAKQEVRDFKRRLKA